MIAIDTNVIIRLLTQDSGDTIFTGFWGHNTGFWGHNI